MRGLDRVGVASLQLDDARSVPGFEILQRLGRTLTPSPREGNYFSLMRMYSKSLQARKTHLATLKLELLKHLSTAKPGDFFHSASKSNLMNDLMNPGADKSAITADTGNPPALLSY